jgi:hypothetical protein
MITSADRQRWRFARVPRFKLRNLLLLFVPLSIALIFLNHARQKEQAIAAFDLMCSKGMDALASDGSAYTFHFKNGNVTDDDLLAFIPAFNGHAPSGFIKAVRIDLGGSKISSETIDRFHRAVPHCEIVR